MSARHCGESPLLVLIVGGVGLTRPPSPSPGVPRARCPPVARPRIPRDRVRPRVRGAHPVGRPARGVLRGSVGAAERRREDDAGARGVRGESAVAPRDVRRTAPRLERRRVHEGVATRPEGGAVVVPAPRVGTLRDHVDDLVALSDDWFVLGLRFEADAEIRRSFNLHGFTSVARRHLRIFVVPSRRRNRRGAGHRHRGGEHSPLAKIVRSTNGPFHADEPRRWTCSARTWRGPRRRRSRGRVDAWTIVPRSRVRVRGSTTPSGFREPPTGSSRIRRGRCGGWRRWSARGGADTEGVRTRGADTKGCRHGCRHGGADDDSRALTSPVLFAGRVMHPDGLEHSEKRRNATRGADFDWRGTGDRVPTWRRDRVPTFVPVPVPRRSLPGTVRRHRRRARSRGGRLRLSGDGEGRAEVAARRGSWRTRWARARRSSPPRTAPGPKETTTTTKGTSSIGTTSTGTRWWCVRITWRRSGSTRCASLRQTCDADGRIRTLTPVTRRD